MRSGVHSKKMGFNSEAMTTQTAGSFPVLPMPMTVSSAPALFGST